jgi:hypothetical protein
MKDSSPVVLVNHKQMKAVDLFAKAGAVSDAFILDVFRRVMTSLEEAHASFDPAHSSFASTISPHRPAITHDNVVRFPVKDS